MTLLKTSTIDDNVDIVQNTLPPQSWAQFISNEQKIQESM